MFLNAQVELNPVPTLAIGSNRLQSFGIALEGIARSWEELRVFARDLTVLAKKDGTGIQYSTDAYCAARATAQICKLTVLALTPEYQVYTSHLCVALVGHHRRHHAE